MTRFDMRVALAQINVTVGDLQANAEKIARVLTQAKEKGADLALFPELAVTGYPPEDLLFKPSFIRENLQAIRSLEGRTRGLTALIGFVDRSQRRSPTHPRGLLYNAAAVLQDGKLIARYHKMMLPNYGVFDEKRYFTSGEKPMVLGLSKGARRSIGVTRSGRPLKVGVSICEDIWVDEGPCQWEAAQGARLLVNLSASPYHAGKRHERERLLARRAKAYQSWIAYVNLVGGQDELIFDGGSFLVNPKGKVVFRGSQFEEGLFLVEVPVQKGRSKAALRRSALPLSPEEEIFKALVLGTRDYVKKNGFSRVVIGLSGGIDSALTACIATAALGKEAVTGVSMPSRYSSADTQSDAKATALALGIQFLEIPIEPMFRAFLAGLSPTFAGRPPDVTEENLQARIRGTILMALSNKFHGLVLATGNKSELSTGYCTLYGDMVGGFAVIKDLPKSWVYRIARFANRFFGKAAIPDSVFRRAPSAELKPNQTDQDTLPPYPLLDSILKAYIEEDRSTAQIHKRLKAPRKEVERVLRMIDQAEYKRRQAPIGIKITPRAFGKDRRMPVTNRFRDV